MTDKRVKLVIRGGKMMKVSGKPKRMFDFRGTFICFAFMIFDIFAVNFSYFIALVIRFYFNSEFNSYGLVYIPAFQKIAPWYTVACILIFWIFRHGVLRSRKPDTRYDIRLCDSGCLRCLWHRQPVRLHRVTDRHIF